MNFEFRIRSFTDLNAWKEGHALVVELYQMTARFPRAEIFGLTNQLRRAGVSITSNIAEGFSRNSLKEKVQFFTISLGSLTEIQSQLVIARDVGYIQKEEFDKIAQQTVKVAKILRGLIKKTGLMIQNSRF